MALMKLFQRSLLFVTWEAGGCFELVVMGASFGSHTPAFRVCSILVIDELRCLMLSWDALQGVGDF